MPSYTSRYKKEHVLHQKSNVKLIKFWLDEKKKHAHTQVENKGFPAALCYIKKIYTSKTIIHCSISNNYFNFILHIA